MWIILGVLAAGIAVGMLVRLGDRHIKIVQFLQRTGVVVLIFCMGIGIGGDRELVKNIKSMGLKAATFALFTIVFSVTLVYIATKKYSKDQLIVVKSFLKNI